MARSKQKPTTNIVEIRVEEKTAEEIQEYPYTVLLLEPEETIRHKCHGRHHPNLDSKEANDMVVESLFDMATKSKNSMAAIFWAKARCGAQEKARDKEQSSDQAPTIVIRTEEKPLER